MIICGSGSNSGTPAYIQQLFMFLFQLQMDYCDPFSNGYAKDSPRNRNRAPEQVKKAMATVD